MSYLRLEGITKRFGTFVANQEISLSIAAGSIHALLGENGAGKTTLMNILCGLYQPDAGQIYLNDRPIHISSSRAAIRYGIGMIHQHFMLVPQLTVTENVILGINPLLRLNLKQQGEQIAALSQSYGLEVDPTARVGDLPVGAQQRVEILKALYRQAKVLILDEPTAVLTPLEVQSFFNVLRQLANQGHTIIFISHKLEEVMQLCHAVTILRRGQVVASTTIEATTQQQLAELMVGREIHAPLNLSTPPTGQITLEVTGLQVRDDRGLIAVQDVSFQLQAGEILGIAGVDGNGQRELADAIVGLRPAAQGQISLQGQDITRWPLQQRLQRLKLGYIPEDRQTMGLIMSFSIARNLILKLFQQIPFCRHWLLQQKVIQAHSNQAISQFDIRASHSNLRVSQLSGGNQQKVVLARELSGEPSLIIAMQPTRGLDVGATEYVQRALLAERDRGAAILYISTELEEIRAMSNRIAVMYAGRFADIVENATASIEQIGLLMVGGSQAITKNNPN